MLFFLFSDQELRRCSPGSATTTTRNDPAHDRLLRPAHLARLDAESRHPRRVLAGLDPNAHGIGSCARWTATSATSRVGRPKKASTWVSCPGRWTCCSATTSAATFATAYCSSLLPLLDRLDGLAFSMQFRGTPLRVSIAGHELTVHAMPEGFRRPARIGVGDEVRELGAGDSWVFNLSQ